MKTRSWRIYSWKFDGWERPCSGLSKVVEISCLDAVIRNFCSMKDDLVPHNLNIMAKNLMLAISWQLKVLKKVPVVWRTWIFCNSDVNYRTKYHLVKKKNLVTRR